MSGVRLVAIQCDDCGRKYGPMEDATIEGQRARARARGWLTRAMANFRDSGVRLAHDFCPKCIKRRDAALEIYDRRKP